MFVRPFGTPPNKDTRPPNYAVGVKHRGQPIGVQYVPEENSWLLLDAAGNPWRAVPASEISRERILTRAMAAK